jgi:hypothetical protein
VLLENHLQIFILFIEPKTSSSGHASKMMCRVSRHRFWAFQGAREIRHSSRTNEKIDMMGSFSFISSANKNEAKAFSCLYTAKFFNGSMNQKSESRYQSPSSQEARDVIRGPVQEAVLLRLYDCLKKGNPTRWIRLYDCFTSSQVTMLRMPNKWHTCKEGQADNKQKTKQRLACLFSITYPAFGLQPIWLFPYFPGL